MQDLIIKTAPLAPSKGIHPQEVIDQFNWRKTGVYTGKSFIGLCADIQEPIWWNRPLDSDVLCKVEADGNYSYNFPYIYKTPDFKTKYNILVNKNSIPVISQIKINENWTQEDIKLLNKFILKVVYKSLIDLGIPKSNLELIKNDLLFNGKKFMGSEEVIRDGYYSMDCLQFFYGHSLQLLFLQEIFI